MTVKAIEPLDENSVKGFFSELLTVYQKLALENFKTESKKLRLLNSSAKVEIIMDASQHYAIALFSKGNPSIIVEKYQDPLMVVATANSRKYEYSDAGKFLYLFQISSKQFPQWNPENFAQDLIRYELASFEKSRLI